MIQRRTFIQNLWAAGLLSNLPTFWMSQMSSPADTLAEPEMLRILEDPAAVKEIGQSFLQQYPDQADQQTLLSQFNGRTGSSTEAETRIAACIKEDFKLGNTVQVKGWILSFTEAQHCALYS